MVPKSAFTQGCLLYRDESEFHVMRWVIGGEKADRHFSVKPESHRVGISSSNVT